MATYGLTFHDEFTGEDFAQDMGLFLPTAEAAREAAKASWEEAGRLQDLPYAADLKWEGPTGTAAYEMSMGPGSATSAYTVTYTVYEK